MENKGILYVLGGNVFDFAMYAYSAKQRNKYE